MRRKLTWVVVLCLTFVGVAALAPTAAAQMPTGFEVHLGDWGPAVWLESWPIGATLTITIDDTDPTTSPDYEISVTVEEEEFGVSLAYDIEAGDLVAVTDGTTLLSHVVTAVAVTGVDVVADVVHGTAQPFSEVGVYTDPYFGYLWMFAGDDGSWMVDFSAVFDIVPGSRGGAQQWGPEGNSTVYDWEVPRPEGWQYNPASDHYYLYVEEGMPWQDAEAYAVSLGGHLVTINDAAEDEWLVETLGTEYWIGLNDIAVEGEWVWASGEPVSYTNWCPDEPNDLEPGEDAVMIWNRPPIGWNDIPVDSWVPFVVEVTDPPSTLEDLLDEMVEDGRLPSERVADNILKKAERGQVSALTRYLSALVGRGLITQATMDEILAAAF